MTGPLVGYYDRRVPEYDEIYDRPERQEELARLRHLVRTALTGERVLELACGTGYWTAVAAEVAAAVLAAFWWSHVPRGTLPGFLAGLAARLGTGRRALFLDNRYVEHESTPICFTDAEGNTYQRRRLRDGSEHEIMKNFPSRDQLLAAVEGIGERVIVRELRYYRYLECVFLPTRHLAGLAPRHPIT